MKVQPASLDWALHHVTGRGDTDIFPLPFEYSAITHDWDAVRSHLASQDLDTWATRPFRSMLSPKPGLGFRYATQLDPFDTLLMCALIYESGGELESARVPTSEKRVFSYRFAPDAEGRMYDQQHNFESFRVRSLELASEPTVEFVLMTDIADFFPRLYSHPMENALVAAASTTKDHARVIKKLVSSWNQSVTRGVPVGPSPFRLIAEVTVADVDEALLSEGWGFCRFADDYRIFVASKRQAREALAFLARTLINNHQLTLQGSKTEIIPVADFILRFSRTEQDRERHALKQTFSALAEALGLHNKYDEPVVYEHLPEDKKAAVDSLNLWVIVAQEAQEKVRPLDIPLMRFVLNRIAQLGLREQNDVLRGNIERFAPVFQEVIDALVMQTGLSEPERHALGGQLLDMFNHEAVGYLEYHREWLLRPFVNEASWNQKLRLTQLASSFHDQPTQRSLTLALGRAGVAHWFKSRKHEVMQLSPWNRRAFLYGASCLPGDEAKHWYTSLKTQLDVLDTAVVNYAKAFPLT